MSECKDPSLAKLVNLGYYPLPCGRSYYTVQCQCGNIEDVFAWRGTKRCSRCGLILNIKYSPEGRLIVAELPKPKLTSIPEVKITATCIHCGQVLKYRHGMGWVHEDDKEHDHPALPDFKMIKKETIAK